MATAPQQDDFFPAELIHDFVRTASSPSTVRSPHLRKLDQLLDWYDNFRPTVAEVAVGVARATVIRWGIKPEERGGPLVYRNKLLLPKAKATDE